MKRKDRITAGILALLLGAFGVHRFYLGQVGLGILYAVLCWFPVFWIIAFVDAIILLTMEDEAFDAKYNKHLAFNSYQYSQNAPNTPQYGQNQRPQYQPPRPQTTYSSPQPKQSAYTRPTQSNPYKDEGTKLYREYDFKGAIASYQKALQVAPNDSIVHFNLACLYSLNEEVQQSFYHLEQAVSNGFDLLDKIKTHGHLAYLRTQPEFPAFQRNGYSSTPRTAQKNETPSLPPRGIDEIDLTSDAVMQKLERLANLRDRGILTPEEFAQQKAKIINQR